MMRKSIFVIIIPILVVVSSAGYFFYQRSLPLVSPLSAFISPLSSALGLTTSTPKAKKVIYGFLPYWNLKETDNLRLSDITTLAYFGLDFDHQGNIIKKTPDTYAEPGWSNLNGETLSRLMRQIKMNSGKTIIVLRAMTQSVIESIVNSSAIRKKVIDNSIAVMESKNFDGINIDFEYAGSPDERTRNNYSTFVKELSIACKTKHPTCQIDIDVFADSASRYRIWDFTQITPYVDTVVIMAYDFFRSSSSQAGPVAPLRGACDDNPKSNISDQISSSCLDYDVSQSIADFTKVVPAEKILLGVPYYGYQWRTASTEFLANAYPDSGSIATFKRIQSILSEQDEKPKYLDGKSLPAGRQVIGIQTFWDSRTFTSRVVFEDPPGQIQQISYEDEHSLSLKYDLVNESNLGGIAIWALGYDGSYPQLWELLEQKFFSH